MNVLLSLLHSSPEYESLRAMLDAGQTAAVSGVSQIARAHWIAALHEDTGRPVVAVCQDEMAASLCAMAVVAFNGAKAYYEEKHDKATFVKNIISDNILLGDIYTSRRAGSPSSSRRSKRSSSAQFRNRRSTPPPSA